MRTNQSTSIDEVKILMKGLLQKVERVNFHELLSEEDRTSSKITRQQYQVCVIDRLLKLASNNQWGLTRSGQFIYVFNGEYWIQIDNDKFQSFLGKAAGKMGVPEMDAKHYLFREQLLKQFFAVASLSNYGRNRNRVLINLRNGTYEITPEDNRLRAFEKGDFMTYQLPFGYNGEAPALTFQAYLDKVLPDKECQDVLAEFIGYVFARDLKLEKCLLLYGGGSNGKSVFYEVINALLGQENVCNFSLSNLAEEHNRAFIGSKLLNYGSEIRGNIETDIFKQLASGERIQCRLKHGNSFFIEDYARLCFNCNELPREVEHTEAFFRRFLIVPFNVTIPEGERDPELANKIIRDELSGVFNWVLEGVRRLLVNKAFSRSVAVQNEVDDYKRQADNVYLFLTEGIYDKSDRWNLLRFIYEDYKAHCRNSGYSALNQRNFSRRLQSMGHLPVKRNSGVGYFLWRTALWG
jgi:putative DNA primase/helicase